MLVATAPARDSAVGPRDGERILTWRQLLRLDALPDHHRGGSGLPVLVLRGRLYRIKKLVTVVASQDHAAV